MVEIELRDIRFGILAYFIQVDIFLYLFIDLIGIGILGSVLFMAGRGQRIFDNIR